MLVTSIPTPSIWSRLADVARLVATPLEPSHYLELVNPLWSSREIHARVEAVRDEAEGVRTLVLRPGRGWRPHRAGQHVSVSLSLHGRRATRVFSIASSPDRTDGCVEITIKAAQGGRVTPTLVRDVLPGTHLILGEPKGDFVLPEIVPDKLLFITAGSGITPVMSMVRAMALRGPLPDLVHIHYAPSAEEVIFRDELAELASLHARYALNVVETRDDRARPGVATTLSAGSLEQLCPDWREREAWACGPRAMLDTIETIAPRTRMERYQAKLSASVPTGAGGKVRFAKSGVESRADGRTALLVVAENAGVAAPHGCRMGICHSCDVTLVSGCVRDLRTGNDITECGARVQVCVSAAAGDVELDL